MKLDSWAVQANLGLVFFAAVIGLPFGPWGIGALLLLFCAGNALLAVIFLVQRYRRTAFTLLLCMGFMLLTGGVLCSLFPIK